MTKQKPSAAKQAAELKALNTLPREETMQRMDALLRNMLNTPPEPYTPKAKDKKRK